jgi:hypothetical protein
METVAGRRYRAVKALRPAEFRLTVTFWLVPARTRYEPVVTVTSLVTLGLGLGFGLGFGFFLALAATATIFDPWVVTCAVRLIVPEQVWVGSPWHETVTDADVGDRTDAEVSEAPSGGDTVTDTPCPEAVVPNSG